ncbi:hypothetical protein B0F90DRAFT_1720081 [Multifurca ochricompacta]|uniref:Uncharacterized protein n=1 Tax=Multifurca ochricompacta TaxID=376703 RepID=A0AAD4QME2_9AGAM|nr:hypothetical protein B0F90DRAFT_1720081 [Multifurca ochricompacta]
MWYTSSTLPLPPVLFLFCAYAWKDQFPRFLGVRGLKFGYSLPTNRANLRRETYPASLACVLLPSSNLNSWQPTCNAEPHAIGLGSEMTSEIAHSGRICTHNGPNYRALT